MNFLFSEYLIDNVFSYCSSYPWSFWVFFQAIRCQQNVRVWISQGTATVCHSAGFPGRQNQQCAGSHVCRRAGQGSGGLGYQQTPQVRHAFHRRQASYLLRWELVEYGWECSLITDYKSFSTRFPLPVQVKSLKIFKWETLSWIVWPLGSGGVKFNAWCRTLINPFWISPKPKRVMNIWVKGMIDVRVLAFLACIYLTPFAYILWLLPKFDFFLFLFDSFSPIFLTPFCLYLIPFCLCLTPFTNSWLPFHKFDSLTFSYRQLPALCSGAGSNIRRSADKSCCLRASPLSGALHAGKSCHSTQWCLDVQGFVGLLFAQGTPHATLR